MIKYKAGVTLEGVCPEMLIAVPIVEAVLMSHDIECAVTAAKEPRPPTPKSLHPDGKAVDFRTHQINPYLLPTIREEIKKALGQGYDVVIEIFYPDVGRTHLHVEFDPK